MEGRKQFTFYRSFCRSIEQLPPEDQFAILRAIMYYGLDQILPDDLTATQKSVFFLIQPILDTGRKRADAGKQGGSKTKANQKQTLSEKEREKENEIENEIEDECLDDGEGFETFWKAYPLKVGKAKALQSWHTVRPDLEAVLQGLSRWKASAQWEREDGRFIPRAWRWLEEKQFLDHPDPGKRPIYGATGVLGQAELESIRQVMGT